MGSSIAGCYDALCLRLPEFVSGVQGCYDALCLCLPELFRVVVSGSQFCLGIFGFVVLCLSVPQLGFILLMLFGLVLSVSVCVIDVPQDGVASHEIVAINYHSGVDTLSTVLTEPQVRAKPQGRLDGVASHEKMDSTTTHK